eukprot:892285_1
MKANLNTVLTASIFLCSNISTYCFQSSPFSGRRSHPKNFKSTPDAPTSSLSIGMKHHRRKLNLLHSKQSKEVETNVPEKGSRLKENDNDSVIPSFNFDLGEIIASFTSEMQTDEHR